MKRISSLFLLFALAGCYYQESPNITSGGALRDAMGESIVSLSFRVKQEAVDLRRFSALIDQTKSWKEDTLPSSWPAPGLDKLAKAFCYLHKEDYCSLNVKSFTVSELSNIERKIVMLLPNDQTFQFNLDYQVTHFVWMNDYDQKVTMTKIDDRTWSIQVEDEALLWTPELHQVCYNENCFTN
ncbi:MAG: hypothetical protein ACOYL6_08080 [Bacteriovoracaceae bacterium]